MALDRKCEEMLGFFTQDSQNRLFFNLKSTELFHNFYIEGVIFTLNVAHREVK